MSIISSLCLTRGSLYWRLPLAEACQTSTTDPPRLDEIICPGKLSVLNLDWYLICWIYEWSYTNGVVKGEPKPKAIRRQNTKLESKSQKVQATARTEKSGEEYGTLFSTVRNSLKIALRDRNLKHGISRFQQRKSLPTPHSRFQSICWYLTALSCATCPVPALFQTLWTESPGVNLEWAPLLMPLLPMHCQNVKPSRLPRRKGYSGNLKNGFLSDKQ